MLSAKKCLLFLLILAILIWVAVFALPDQNLHLIFCDVGQGDAILITHGFKQVLIDGGPDERVLQCLGENMPFWDREIELMVLTHPDADHLTGLISVLERYKIQAVLINNLSKDTALFYRFRDVLLEEKASLYHPRAGERIKISGLDFSVLWPDADAVTLRDPPTATQLRADRRVTSVESLLRGDPKFPRSGKDDPEKTIRDRKNSGSILSAVYPGDFNETSIVLRLEYGDFCAFLPGDIGIDTESSLDIHNRGYPCQVLKVPHHGSKFSTSEELLSHLQPDLAIISVGKNHFGHPTKEVLERLAKFKIKTLRTDQSGEIEIITDGQKWQIFPERK